MKIQGINFKKSYTIKIQNKDINMRVLSYAELRRVEDQVPLPQRPMKQVVANGQHSVVPDKSKEGKWEEECEHVEELRLAAKIYLSFDDPAVQFDNKFTLEEIDRTAAQKIYDEMGEWLPATAWGEIAFSVSSNLHLTEEDLQSRAQSFLAQQAVSGSEKGSQPAKENQKSQKDTDTSTYTGKAASK